jgi:hypothetical protein
MIPFIMYFLKSNIMSPKVVFKRDDAKVLTFRLFKLKFLKGNFSTYSQVLIMLFQNLAFLILILMIMIIKYWKYRTCPVKTFKL